MSKLDMDAIAMTPLFVFTPTGFKCELFKGQVLIRVADLGNDKWGYAIYVKKNGSSEFTFVHSGLGVRQQLPYTVPMHGARNEAREYVLEHFKEWGLHGSDSKHG